MVLICISLIISDIEHLFICLLAISMSSSVKFGLFTSFGHVLIGCLGFFGVEFYKFFILDINPLSDVLVNMFSHAVGCLFILLMIFLCCAKPF